MTKNTKVIRIALIISLALCSSSTVQSNNTEPANANARQKMIECPIYDSQNWHAWFDQLDQSTHTGRLNISGQLQLPSPGYIIEYFTGPLDRHRPPSLRIGIQLKPPVDPVIQVISTEDLRYTVKSSVLHYRSIIIFCGDRQLAEIVDVVPAG